MRTNFSFTGYHLDHLMSDYLTAMLLDFQRTIQTAIRMAVVHQHIHFEKKSKINGARDRVVVSDFGVVPSPSSLPK